jgi:hypothetical protein
MFSHSTAGASKALAHTNARERVELSWCLFCLGQGKRYYETTVSLRSRSKNFWSICSAFNPGTTKFLGWLHGLVFGTEPVLEMYVVQWLTLVLSDGLNRDGVSLPFSPEKKQIQFLRHILFRIPQCTKHKPSNSNILLSESFRTDLHITSCSLLPYFHFTGYKTFVVSVSCF